MKSGAEAEKLVVGGGGTVRHSYACLTAIKIEISEEIF